MSKCNLLAPISRPTGNFVLFSQYAEDLTKSKETEDFYRVTPSKYILLNINPNTGWDSVKYAEVLQNYYEQKCAVFRSNQSIGWTPEYAQAVLWKTLFKFNMIDEPTANQNSTYSSNSVLYVGDINITSTREIDGINYNEIYLNVPSTAQRQKYEFLKYTSDMTRSVQYPYDYIMGYPDSEYPQVSGLWPSNHVTSEYADQTINGASGTEFVYDIFTQNDFSFDFESGTPLTDQSMQFNAIIVLYDITKRNMEIPEDTILYKNIPMGIYFTGKSDGNGGIDNPVTIWTSNPEIYDQGTSYGFRICTRFVSTQNALYIVDSTIEDTSDMYDQYTAVLSKLVESQTILDEMADSMSDYQRNITSHLANIKNYQVNVPYIREIGGHSYWFVNGQNLGVAAHETNLRWENF